MDGMIYAVDPRYPTKYAVETDPDTVNLGQPDYNTNVDSLAEAAAMYLPLAKDGAGNIYTVTTSNNGAFNLTVNTNASEIKLDNIMMTGVGNPNSAFALANDDGVALLSMGSFWVLLGSGAITT